MSCSGSSTSSELDEKEQALAGISPSLVHEITSRDSEKDPTRYPNSILAKLMIGQ
ncbi:hypothetical protein Tco_1257385, partial [Tanacetum coccineum]